MVIWAYTVSKVAGTNHDGSWLQLEVLKLDTTCTCTHLKLAAVAMVAAIDAAAAIDRL